MSAFTEDLEARLRAIGEPEDRIAKIIEIVLKHEPEARRYSRPRTKKYGPYQSAEAHLSPEKIRAYAYAANFACGERVIRLEGSAWWALVGRVFRRDGFVCTYCGAPEADYILHCDHIVPISRGGPNVIENLTTACEFCNSSKCDALPHEWRPLPDA